MQSRFHLLFLSVCFTLTASPVSINNPSFENHDPFTISNLTGAWNSTVVDWTAPAGFVAGQFAPAAATLVPTDGSVVAYVGPASISQVLSENLMAGMVYQLLVDVGRAKGYPNSGYEVSLYAGNTLLAQDTSHTALNEGWKTSMLFYASPSGDPAANQALKIVLTAFDYETEFDNVRLDASATVPEPATSVSLVSAFAAFLTGRIVSRFRRGSHS